MNNGEESQVQLPDEVQLTKFAGARARELAVLTKCISGPLKTKVSFQTLPVHMRRRVMSHNSRRLPRRLRPVVSEDKPPKSRRSRRTKKRLLSDFAHRQRTHSWLETHIWHAKRFHMTKQWGFNLPRAPCDKAFRACYRAGSAHCLLMDVSYLRCLSLSGNVEHLKNGFTHITSTKCGLTTNARCYMNGEREGTTYIYDVDKYPFGCSGKVTFIWNIDDCSNKATVRFFVHPTIYSNLMAIFIKCFELFKIQTNLNENGEVSCNDSATLITDVVYFNNNTCVKMLESKKRLNRFRLLGPLSHAILKDVLKPINILQDESSKHHPKNWFEKLFLNSAYRENHNVQLQYWNKINGLNSPAEIQSNIILGLNVEDPRTSFPEKRTKSLPNHHNSVLIQDIINIPKGLNFSLLWNDEIIKNVSNNKISNVEINKIRQKENLIPGEPCNLLQSISGVPVILIQHPGSKNSNYKKLGYNCGWDLIVPPEYGMPFWLSLILRGARSGGLREASQLLFENGICDFQPDTEASKIENSRQENILKNKYFRLPPNKRVNFRKLSVNSPFICRWKELIENWIEKVNISDYFVLRDKKMLQELQLMLKQGVFKHDFQWDMTCLIPVRISLKNKGNVKDNALICIPLDSNKCSSSSSVVEPLKKDENSQTRKDLRMRHKRQLKILRRKSIRKNRKVLDQSKNIITKQDNSLIITKYANEMQELWLPSNFNNVRNQCSQETMGYVVKGDFSFSEAKSVGIGYVALKSLSHLLQKQSSDKNVVLVRNILSRQYRYAFIEVIPDML